MVDVHVRVGSPHVAGKVGWDVHVHRCDVVVVEAKGVFEDVGANQKTYA